MRVEPAAIGSGVGDDEPLADGQRIPSALPGDLRGEPPLAVRRPEQLVDVGDGGLELDDKQGLVGSCQARMSITPRSP